MKTQILTKEKMPVILLVAETEQDSRVINYLHNGTNLNPIAFSFTEEYYEDAPKVKGGELKQMPSKVQLRVELKSEEETAGNEVNKIVSESTFVHKPVRDIAEIEKEKAEADGVADFEQPKSGEKVSVAVNEPANI